MKDPDHQVRIQQRSRTRKWFVTNAAVHIETVVTPRRPARAPHFVLVGVILIFIVMSSLIALKTPAFESDDEPDHVQNIETLVSGHWYGIPSSCLPPRHVIVPDCAGTEPQQAPLYYLLLAGWQLVAGIPAQAPYRAQVNPGFFYGSPQLFIHKSTAVPGYLIWLRLLNVLFGALTVLVTFLAVRLIASDPWTPVIAASLVAFLPRMVFLSSFVNNDNLINLLGAVLTFAVLRYAKAPSYARMAAVGVVLGLLFTTKLSALPMVLVLIPLSLFMRGLTCRAWSLCVGVGASLVVSGWYFIQNTVRYGDPLAGHASAVYLAKVGGLGTPVGQPYEIGNPWRLVFGHVPYLIVESFWYESGWNTFRWPLTVDVLFCLATGAALLGLLNANINARTLISLASLSIAALLSVWAVALQAGSSARYALVGLPAMAALAALGLQRWKLPFRWLLPAMALCGTLVAIQSDVLGFHWT